MEPTEKQIEAGLYAAYGVSLEDAHIKQINVIKDAYTAMQQDDLVTRQRDIAVQELMDTRRKLWLTWGSPENDERAMKIDLDIREAIDKISALARKEVES